MHIDDQNIPILILAAGSSSRLGRAKQLLDYKEQKLINYIIDQSIKSQTGNIYVVLGANFSEINNVIKNENVNIIENIDWENGMSTSINLGINFILESEINLKGIMILLCDQIHVNYDLLMKIKAQYFQDNTPILCCKYDDDNYGPPVIFNTAFIQDLMKLKGQAGAKKIIDKHIDKVQFYSFDLGTIDIDTESDVQKWL